MRLESFDHDIDNFFFLYQTKHVFYNALRPTIYLKIRFPAENSISRLYIYIHTFPM